MLQTHMIRPANVVAITPARANATYVDFKAEGGIDAALASDGVHPTAAGYAIMTPLAQRAIDATLARRGARP